MSRNHHEDDSEDLYSFTFDESGAVIAVAEVEDDGSLDPERIDDDEVYELVGDYVIKTETDDGRVRWTAYAQDAASGYWTEVGEGRGTFQGETDVVVTTDDDGDDDSNDDNDADEDYHDFDIDASGIVTGAYEVDANGNILETENINEDTYVYADGLVTVTEEHRGYTETTVFAENAAGLWYEVSQTFTTNAGGSFSGGVEDDDCDGSDDDDDIAGGGGNDWLRGGHGNDHIRGGRGDDTLCLDDGDDTIVGGVGNDWLEVDGTDDATISLATRGVQNTGYGNDRISGIHHASGGSGHDRLTGNRQDNELHGNGGRDILRGRAGDDTLSGGSGRDVLNGGAHDDDLSGDGGNDRLIGANGDDDISGGTGNDRCFGGRGSDMIDGGAGRDIMDAGRDRVVDTFVFTSVDDSTVDARDVIRRFDAGEDKIDLTMIDADGASDGDQAFLWSEEAAANSVWTESVGRRSTLVSADVDGDGVADMQIILRGTTGITADDFIL